MNRLLPATGTLLGALLFVSGAVGSTEPTWKVYRDETCGIELKYPPQYALEASGARDVCAAWIRIVVRGPKRPHPLASLEVVEGGSVTQVEAADAGTLPAARALALQVATSRCTADGPTGSTYCTNGEVRATFRTAQGFRGLEVHLTEVHETVVPKTVERRPRGPILALDLSDDEAVRILIAEAEPGRVGDLRMIVDALRVWTKARRHRPHVVDADTYLTAPQAFAVRIGTGVQAGRSRAAPSPVTSWFLTDPRGRRLGRDPVTGAWFGEVPAVTHGARSESGFVLREPLEGRYELQVAASLPSVHYQIAVQAPDRAGQPARARHDGRTAEPGAVDRYEIVYAPGTARAVTLVEVPDFSRLSILLSSPGSVDVAGEAILTDPRGRQTGVDSLARTERRMISRSTPPGEGSARRSTMLEVRQPMDGAYLLQVTGTTVGTYTLDVRAWDRNGVVARPELRDVPTAPGMVHRYRLDYMAAGGTPLRLGGGFEGDRLLGFAMPIGAETRLAVGSTSFPLTIFYNVQIDPVTFNALLNGDNISGRFTPKPGAYQIVRIPLRSGVNTLVLSVDGASGGAETRRHVFRVDSPE